MRRLLPLALTAASLACSAGDVPNQGPTSPGDPGQPITPTKPGEPLPDLTPDQLQLFNRGTEVFAMVFTPAGTPGIPLHLPRT